MNDESANTQVHLKTAIETELGVVVVVLYLFAFWVIKWLLLLSVFDYFVFFSRVFLDWTKST